MDGGAPTLHRSRELILQPHQTILVDPTQGLSEAKTGSVECGGVSINYSGAPGSVFARTMIQNPSTGFSSSVQLSDPGKAKSSRLHGAGLRLGETAGEDMALMVAARNIGETTALLRGSIRYTRSDGGTGVMALGKVRLSPGEVKAWEAKEAALLRRLDIVSAGLEFEYSTQPGSVLVSALSVSRSGNQVFQVPMLDPKAQKSSTGVYPFYLDYGYSTVVYIKNTTAVEQKYITHFNYEGGEYMIGVKSIAAGETVAIDVRALRDNQVADEEGRTIPVEVMRGQARWTIILEEGSDLLAMIGRSELVNEARGISSTYACQNCCGDHAEDDFITPEQTQLQVGQSAILRAYEQRLDCYGYPYDVQRSATWSSDNQSVAKVGNKTGTVTSMGAGQTTIHANWQSIGTEPQQCGGPLGAIPNLPAPIPCCTSNSHFGSGSASVQVTALPDHLVVVDEQQGFTTDPGGGGTCATPYYIRQTRFRVVSSDSNGALPTGDVVVEERFDSVSPNSCGNGQPQSASCATTVNNGTFVDSISAGCGSANGSANCGYDITWKWYWCGNAPGTGGILILASLAAEVRKSSVVLNGRSTNWPPGTAFRP